MFGRLDFEAVARALYVGRRWVHDEEGEQVVVNWQAPAARPFYTATPQDPQRVTLRRRFRAQGRKLIDIADEALDGSTLDGASVGDFLLEELERSRDTHMRDIVATIQADQYRLITRAPERPLVIQGGPGTGKTAVGLHRASWLIYTEREKNARSRVLVVGPNRTFMEYVSHVLPGARRGQRGAARGPGSRPRRRRRRCATRPAVARLKADARLAEVIARAVELRLAAEPEELNVEARGRVHPRPGPRDRAPPGRGPRPARHDRRRARALPDGNRPRASTRVRPRAPGRRDPRRGGGREGAQDERAAQPSRRPSLAVGHAREARALAVHDARVPGRGRGRDPRRGRATAAAAAGSGVERRRPGRCSTRRTRSSASRRARTTM